MLRLCVKAAMLGPADAESASSLQHHHHISFKSILRRAVALEPAASAAETSQVKNGVNLPQVATSTKGCWAAVLLEFLCLGSY